MASAGIPRTSPVHDNGPMSRARSTVMVGREVELARLRAALDRTTDQGSQLVVLAGEAGVGKSRCLKAFIDSARSTGATVLLGRCPLTSAGELPYVPLADALRTLARTTPVDRLTTWLGGGSAALSRLAPGIGGVSAHADVGELPEFAVRLCQEWFNLLERISADGAVILAIEDVHWSDRSTRDLLALLLHASIDQGVLVILTLRTDELASNDSTLGWLAEILRADSAERLDLARFDLETTKALVSALLGAPDSRLAERLHRRTRGNPFFIEELLAASRGGSAGLPTTIRDGALVRFQELPEPVQGLVCAAAIINAASPTVDHEVLRAVADLPDEGLIVLVRAAIEAHILIPSADSYVFRHELTREAIQTTMLPAVCRRVHAAIATSLAAQSGASDPVWLGRIAHHWNEAGNDRCALAAAVKAGQAAEAAHGYPEAAVLYERAALFWTRVRDAEATTDMDHAELLARAAEATMQAHHNERAVELAKMALALGPDDVEPDRAARLHTVLGRADWTFTGDSEFAIKQCETALKLATSPGPARAEALTLYSLLLMIDDRFDELAAVAAEAVEVARTAGDASAEAFGLTYLATCHMNHGNDNEAFALLDDALHLARRHGLYSSVRKAHFQRALAYEYGGQLDKAADSFLDSVRERGGFESEMERVLGYSCAATNLVDAGRWVEAEAVTTWMPTQSRFLRIFQLMSRVPLLLARGDLAESKTLMDEMNRLVATVHDVQFVEPAATLSTELALLTRDLHAARAAVRHGLAGLSTGRPYIAIPLCWLGLRAEADVVAAGEAPNAAAVDLLRETLARSRSGGGDAVYLVRNHALGLLADGELRRLDGRADPTIWAAAAEAYRGMGARYRALYPQWRAAEAYLAVSDRVNATRQLRQVFREAGELGAEPILVEVKKLARRARIFLDEGSAPRLKLPFSLTPREVDVLRLVASGLTNRRIATALFLSEGTVAVHVSRVLSKVGATRRTEAAAIAHRAGLIEAV